MKYLVTGGAGFIGSNLVEALVNNGHDVIVIDNLHTGSMANLEEFKDRVKIHVTHVSEAHEIEDASGLDGIFHLGMPSSSPMYKQNPLLVGKAVTEFISMLELAKRENCKLVYASTSSIYNGNPTPWKEDMPVHVTDFYSEARHYMERLAKYYNDVFGIKSIGLRFFSVYGPREEAKKNYANLVTQFAWAMKRGEPPVIYGDGEQRRDFTFVSDIVNGLILSMNSNVEFSVYNLGTGQSYSLNELIDILNKVLGTELRPKYVVNQVKNYVQDTLADTDKAEAEIGFKAKYSLEQGMREYL